MNQREFQVRVLSRVELVKKSDLKAREKMRDKIKEHRKRRREAGICSRCNSPVRPGSNLCDEHRKDVTRKERLQTLHLRNLRPCLICGDLFHHRYCPEHRKAGARAERQASTARNPERGICSHCGVYGHKKSSCVRLVYPGLRTLYREGPHYELSPSQGPDLKCEVIGHLQPGMHLILSKGVDILPDDTGASWLVCPTNSIVKVLKVFRPNVALVHTQQYPGRVFYLRIRSWRKLLNTRQLEVRLISEAHRLGLVPEYEPLNDVPLPLFVGDEFG